MNEYQLQHLDQRLLKVESQLHDWETIIDKLMSNPFFMRAIEKRWVCGKCYSEPCVCEIAPGGS